MRKKFGNIGDLQTLMAPAIYRKHWSLFCVDVKKKSIKIYDSLRQGTQAEFEPRPRVLFYPPPLTLAI